MAKLMNIGFGNVVNTDKVIGIISSDSAPAKRVIARGKEQERLIDATQGRRTKSVIFTENDKIILSALQPETLAGRYNGSAANGIAAGGSTSNGITANGAAANDSTAGDDAEAEVGYVADE